MKQANHGAIDNQQLVSIIERIEKLNNEAEERKLLEQQKKQIEKISNYYIQIFVIIILLS